MRFSVRKPNIISHYLQFTNQFHIKYLMNGGKKTCLVKQCVYDHSCAHIAREWIGNGDLWVLEDLLYHREGEEQPKSVVLVHNDSIITWLMLDQCQALCQVLRIFRQIRPFPLLVIMPCFQLEASILKLQAEASLLKLDIAPQPLTFPLQFKCCLDITLKGALKLLFGIEERRNTLLIFFNESLFFNYSNKIRDPSYLHILSKCTVNFNCTKY